MVGMSDAPYLRQRAVANPAAGVDWRYTCEGQGIQRLVALHANFLASAAVANRLPILTLSDGSLDYAAAPIASVITATQSIDATTYPGAAPGAVNANLSTFGAPTDGWLLLPGWSLRTVTQAIDAADQWSDINLWVVEYPTGPQWRQTPDLYTIIEPKG